MDIIYKASKKIFRLYAKEKNYGSFWVGVKKQDGSWFKTSGEILNKVEVDVINDWSDGDCMIVDAENDFRHKVVGCDLKYKVGFHIEKSLERSYVSKWLYKLGQDFLDIQYDEYCFSLSAKWDPFVLKTTPGFLN